MTAYVMVRIEAEDHTKLKEYQKAALSTLEKFNGKILVRGGEVDSLEGPVETRKVVLLEFKDMKTAKQFYDSEEYAKAIKLRENIASFELIALDGVSSN